MNAQERRSRAACAKTKSARSTTFSCTTRARTSPVRVSRWIHPRTILAKWTAARATKITPWRERVLRTTHPTNRFFTCTHVHDITGYLCIFYTCSAGGSEGVLTWMLSQRFRAGESAGIANNCYRRFTNSQCSSSAYASVMRVCVCEMTNSGVKVHKCSLTCWGTFTEFENFFTSTSRNGYPRKCNRPTHGNNTDSIFH